VILHDVFAFRVNSPSFIEPLLFARLPPSTVGMSNLQDLALPQDGLTVPSHLGHVFGDAARDSVPECACRALSTPSK
jgi:hypothetical protein